ncbi:MAG TPA: DegT/DnrJ/EryC1/StrS aminotransferase family protein [Vicinamibacterales bacterium]|jgi:dTDP-4-amino-4,6-dideoxygalactose transaminase
MPRHVAPAGAPIRAIDLARAAALVVSGADVGATLRRAFQDRFGVRHALLTSTGRAGLTLLLRAMRRLASGDRDEVVLPSYTCFSVAASVVKAGLRPRIVDIRADTLDYDLDQLRRTDFRRVMTVVATNLYGLPNDLPAIADIAREHGAFLVDDAAQAMGAAVGGRASGTWGDAGLYSFDKGKNVAAIDGGMVVTSSDRLASALDREHASLAAPPLTESVSGVMKACVYSLMLRPALYWIPNSIPQLGLGKTVYTTDFPMERPSRPLVALGVTMTKRLDEFNRARRENAASILAGVTAVPGVQSIRVTNGATPVYLRFPVLLPNRDVRQRALEALVAAGIGATASYPSSLVDVPALQTAFAGGAAPAPCGRSVAERVLTIPTHALVRPSDITTTVEILERVVRGRADGLTVVRTKREQSEICAE